MDKSLMLNEIKNYLKLKKETDFADYLGIKTNTLANWRSRNSFDSEIILLKCEFVDPRWLLTGEGSMLKNQEEVQEVAAEPDLSVTALLEEKERFIQYLLRQSEQQLKQLADLESKLELATARLEAAKEVIDMEKERNGSGKDQLKNEEKTGNSVG